MNTNHSLNSLRRQLAIMTVVFCGVMLSVVVALWPYFTAWYSRFIAARNSPCDCSQLAVLPDQSPLLFGLLAAVVFFFFLVARAFTKVILTYYKTRHYERQLQSLIQHRTGLKRFCIYRIASTQLLAVCLGYWRPRIYISTALEKLLSPTELWTVIKHELYHAHQRDPLQRLLIGGLVAFIPLSKKILADYQTLQEVLADEAAADDQQLCQALVKTLDAVIEQPILSAVWFSASGGSATDARLSRLLGHSVQRPIIWPIFCLVIGIMLMTTMLYYSFTTQTPAEVFGQCIAEQPMCELLMSYVAQ